MDHNQCGLLEDNIVQWFTDLIDKIGKKPWLIFVVAAVVFAYIINEQRLSWDAHILDDQQKEKLANAAALTKEKDDHAADLVVASRLARAESDRDHLTKDNTRQDAEIQGLRESLQAIDKRVFEYRIQFGELARPNNEPAGILPPAPEPEE